jgi:LytTr DNA-binding domain
VEVRLCRAKYKALALTLTERSRRIWAESFGIESSWRGRDRGGRDRAGADHPSRSPERRRLHGGECRPRSRHFRDRALGELQERLDPPQFVHIHRSAIFNLAWVAKVQARPRGRLVVQFKDAAQTELQVARERARTFKERPAL